MWTNVIAAVGALVAVGGVWMIVTAARSSAPWPDRRAEMLGGGGTLLVAGVVIARGVMGAMGIAALTVAMVGGVLNLYSGWYHCTSFLGRRAGGVSADEARKRPWWR